MTSEIQEKEKQVVEYRAYRRRFIYLVAAMAVNFSNGNTWISYAAITFYTNDFYGNKNAATFLNVVFMLLSIPVGFLAIWWTDRKGVKSAMWIGATCNLIGNIVRFTGSGSWMPVNGRFPVALLGQVIAALAQPFVMFLSTKLAAVWFPENERAIANTLISMSNPIGIAVMYSTAPLIVNANHPKNFTLLTGWVLIGAIITAVLTLFVTKSKPPTPVAASKHSSVVVPGFGQSLKMCLTSRRYLTLALSLGGAVGAFNALYNNLQPALCSKGYSSGFNGAMGAVLIFSGLVGAAISGVIVDATGKFEIVMKGCLSVAGVAACSLAISVNYENQQAWIVSTIVAFGLFGFAVYPIGLEAGVEATYPVPEACSTGLIIMLGQVEGIVYVLITTLLAQSPDPHTLAVQTCVQDNDSIHTVLMWRNSFMAWLGIVFVLLTLFIVGFKPKMRRRDFEREQAALALTDAEEKPAQLS